jgi:hypothetical protein
VRRLPADPFFDGKDPQHIAQLCAETIDDGHSVLMFCGTKKVRRQPTEARLPCTPPDSRCCASAGKQLHRSSFPDLSGV